MYNKIIDCLSLQIKVHCSSWPILDRGFVNNFSVILPTHSSWQWCCAEHWALLLVYFRIMTKSDKICRCAPAVSSVPVVTLPGPRVVSHNPSFTPGLGHVISKQFPNLSIKLRVCVLWCGGVAGEVLLSRCAAVAVDHHCSQLTQGQTAPSPLKAESCAPATVTPRLLQFYIDTVMKIWIIEGSLLKTHLYKLFPSSNGNAFPHTFLPACSKDFISSTCSVKVVVSRLSCVDFHENWGTLVTAQLPPGTILHFQSHLHITAPHQMLMQKLIYSAKHVDTNITECISNNS